jgi:hypothetical protein
MMRIQFRVRPNYSLLDIDIPLIKRKLANVHGVSNIKVFDDRASDANFITVIVTLTEPIEPILSHLKKAFLHLPNVTTFIVNEHGNEFAVSSVSAQDFAGYSREYEFFT